jgi:hypothetical protein
VPILRDFSRIFAALDEREAGGGAIDDVVDRAGQETLHRGRAAVERNVLQVETGLAIPETLMTNNADEARTFWRRYEGEVIHKQFIAKQGTWRETRRLLKHDEAHLASVNHTPVIFQRHVPAVADLRVTVVDNVVFAAGADVRNATYPQDVRMKSRSKI